MIAILVGTITRCGATRADIDAGGIGCTVELTAPHAASLAIGQQTALHTTLITRPDSMTLYGFATPDEHRIFTRLIALTGVGPRAAMNILGAFPLSELALAIAHQDTTPFRGVAGIGPRTASLIITALRGELDAHLPAHPAGRPRASTPRVAAPGAEDPARAEALAALQALGWPKTQAAQALDHAIRTTDNSGQPPTAPALLRLALARLAPPRT